jgi:hypothetical protein
VQGKAEVSCLLDPEDPTNTRVIVKAKGALSEGTSCNGGSNDGDDSFGPVTLVDGQSTNVDKEPHTDGGDFAHLTLVITNSSGNIIVLNPIKEEQRRQVVFAGTIKIIDDDFGSANEE